MKRLAVLTLALLSMAAAPARAELRHVIVMIADGWGFNHVRAVDCWHGHPAIYENGDWARLALAHSNQPGARFTQHALLEPRPGGEQWRTAMEFTLRFKSSKTMESSPVRDLKNS